MWRLVPKKCWSSPKKWRFGAGKVVFWGSKSDLLELKSGVWGRKKWHFEWLKKAFLKNFSEKEMINSVQLHENVVLQFLISKTVPERQIT